MVEQVLNNEIDGNSVEYIVSHIKGTLSREIRATSAQFSASCDKAWSA